MIKNKTKYKNNNPQSHAVSAPDIRSACDGKLASLSGLRTWCWTLEEVNCVYQQLRPYFVIKQHFGPVASCLDDTKHVLSRCFCSITSTRAGTEFTL